MTPATPRYPGRAPIDAYGNGGFRFAEMSHRGSILCLPSGIYAWQPGSPDEIETAALAPVLAERDALDLLPGSGDIEVRCDGGRTTLTGQVSHKRLKRDAGEIAWAIPSVNDVQNNVTIVPRRRSRPIREAETPVVAGRKQA